MRSISKKSYSVWDLPIAILLVVASNKWLFEGIFDLPIIEAGLLLFGLAIVVLKKGVKIGKASIIWAFYAFSLVLNTLVHGTTISRLGRMLIMLFITFYAMLYTKNNFNMSSAIRLLTYIAVFHSAMIVLQYLLRDSFNSLYFPLLRQDSRLAAQRYFNRGYFFGVHQSPHEVAGILAFVLVAIVLKMFVFRKTRITSVLAVALLLILLLLTGKKGVLIVSLFSLLAAIFILYGSKKQWHRVIKIMLCAVVLAVGFVYYALTHPDNPLFNRIAVFLEGLLTGSINDSGRGNLYEIAINEFGNNPVFGIGWFNFTRITTAAYGYESGHHVNLDYLQWLCEMGVVGFVLNMIPVLVMFYQTMFVSRHVLRRIDSAEKKWQALFAVFIQMYTLIYAFVEVPFYDIYYFSMYMLSCIIISGAYSSYKRKRQLMYA